MRTVRPACPVVRAPRVVRVPARARGFSLIIAMLMLAVIGLASAAIMRNATLGDRVANNNRLQAQASQYAQFALRFCENQLARAPASRSVRLLSAASPPAWSSDRHWTTPGDDAAHTLSASDIGSTVQPPVAPQCMMEATSAPDVYTITARGFSADFRADPGTGSTRAGSAVWLQATIYAPAEAASTGLDANAVATPATGGLTIRRRVWQQLVTPPF